MQIFYSFKQIESKFARASHVLARAQSTGLQRNQPKRSPKQLQPTTPPTGTKTSKPKAAKDQLPHIPPLESNNGIPQNQRHLIC
jgi:hypothetical protein